MTSGIYMYLDKLLNWFLKEYLLEIIKMEE